MQSTMRESFERAAHVAVGAPVAAAKALSARVGDMRDAVRSSRDEIGQEFAREMDEWIAEGERVIERAMKRIRSTDAATAAETAVARTARKTESALVPDCGLSVINGVGSSYEAKMSKAGIDGVNDFMSATGTQEDITALAGATGFTPATIKTWRDQVDLSRVDGIGGSYKTLLRGADIWTLKQLADSDAEDLAAELDRVGTAPDAPDQSPSIYTVRQWVETAKSMIE